MKEIVGEVLVLIGILGFVVLLVIGAYYIFGWIGAVMILCIVSFISGIIILDDGWVV